MKRKRFYSFSMAFVFVAILPAFLEATPVLTKASDCSIYSEQVQSTYSFENLNIISELKDPKIKYSDFHVKVKYYFDESENAGVCRITLNGTIETDIGTVTFDNLTIEVSLGTGQDCADFALRLLRSFQ